MKKIVRLIILSLLIYSCGKNTDSDKPNNSSDKILNEFEIIGVYQGIQENYFMKNKFGDDVIINGNKIELPSVDHKFLFEKNNKVSLQQTSLDDNTRYYYDGNYKILEKTQDVITIECNLSYSEGSSNPSFILDFSLSNDFLICKGCGGGPDFNLSKD
tara:strand:- start:1084 stop:1557 length:474 start_codon:yes stop_codon:yes gene_type:complete